MRHRIDLLHRDILLNLEHAPANAICAQVAELIGIRGQAVAAALAMTLESIAEDPSLADEDREYARQRLDSLPL